jgi:excinuclease ABC subunit A
MGPGAGIHGGEIVAQGTPQDVARHPASLTGQYLSGRKTITGPARRQRAAGSKKLRITGARGNNLQNVTVELPVGLFVCITGVSGSGKSTLINDRSTTPSRTISTARPPSPRSTTRSRAWTISTR